MIIVFKIRKFDTEVELLDCLESNIYIYTIVFTYQLSLYPQLKKDWGDCLYFFTLIRQKNSKNYFI